MARLSLASLFCLLPGLVIAAPVEDALLQLEGRLSAPGPWQCGVPSLLTLERAASGLVGPGEVERLAAVLSPPGMESAREGEARGVVPCGYVLDEVVESDHFLITWGHGGPAYTTTVAAENLLVGLESARLAYLDAGYPEAQGNPGTKIPVYLGNSGSGAPGINFDGAYTTTCASYEHAYVVTSFIDDSATTIDVMNHELFHAVQFNTANQWTMDPFYFEGSAVWAEDLAAPDLNLYAWFLSYYTSYPDLALDYQAGDELGFLHPYATFIVPMGIQDWSPQGSEVLRRVWVEEDGALPDRFDSAFEAVNAETDFATEFGRIAAKTTAMDFHDRAIYGTRPAIRQTFNNDAEVLGVDAPDWYGTHHYALQAPEGQTKVQVTFEGGDDAYLLALARGDGTTVNETVEKVDEDGRGTIVGIDLGTVHTTATLVVLRTRRAGDAYDLQVEFLEQEEDPGSDLDSDDDGGGGSRRGRGSGCATSVHPFQYGSLGLGVLPAAIILRRRRSTAPHRQR